MNGYIKVKLHAPVALLQVATGLDAGWAYRSYTTQEQNVYTSCACAAYLACATDAVNPPKHMCTWNELTQALQVKARWAVPTLTIEQRWGRYKDSLFLVMAFFRSWIVTPSLLLTPSNLKKGRESCLYDNIISSSSCSENEKCGAWDVW
jgi:hypothetical protein